MVWRFVILSALLAPAALAGPERPGAETAAPVTDGSVRAAPLTAVPGDPQRGLALIRDAGKASCLICHAISGLPDRDQGQLGPALDGIAARSSAGELRARLIDARLLNPETIMPPYFSNAGLFRIGARWQGSTIYTAQELEDVLAFLMTLGAPQ